MAGNPIEMVEKYVEKVVLGVCALLFLYGLVHWGFSSSQTVEGKALGQVDQELLDKAKKIQEAAERQPPTSQPMPDYDKILSQLRDARYGQQMLADLGYPGRVLEIRGDVNQGRRKPSLADFADLPKPLSFDTSARLELPRTGADLTDRRVARGAMLYPWEPLKALWEAKLRDSSLNTEPVVFAVECQVRERLSSGQWGEPRAVQGAAGPEDPVVAKLGEDRKTILAYDGGDPTGVRAAVQSLSEEQEQIQALMPPYWPIWDPKGKTWTDWKRGGAVEAMIEQLLSPSSKPAKGAAGAGAGMTTVNPGAGISGVAGPAGPGGGAGMTAGQPLRELPALSAQKQAGTIMAWFHDTSLEETKVYQFRARLVLVNPLLGNKDQASSPQDASQPTLPSPWSEWSREVSVPRATVFFLTGGNPSGGEVSVTVFTRCLGQLVKQEFDVRVGQPIGRKETKDVMNPEQGKMVRQTVDFSTGAIVLDLEFNKRRTGRTGLDVPTTEMLYLDDKGSLRVRNRSEDEESKEYRDWVDLTRPAPPAPPPRS